MNTRPLYESNPTPLYWYNQTNSTVSLLPHNNPNSCSQQVLTQLHLQLQSGDKIFRLHKSLLQGKTFTYVNPITINDDDNLVIVALPFPIETWKQDMSQLAQEARNIFTTQPILVNADPITNDLVQATA